MMENMKNRKSTVARRNMILEKLNTDGEIFVDQLSKEFDVSEVTIRNDLDQLEKKRLLIRARGGAMKYNGGVGMDFGISEKDKIHLNEKIRIGEYAASLVKDGDIIIIDSGTTTAEMAKNLGHFHNLTVITNAINIAIIVSKFPHINLIMLGGMMRKNSQSLVGPIAEKSLSKFHVDKLFLGVDGVNSKEGIFTANMEEAHLNEQMITISNEVIILTDSTKFNRKAFAHICDIQKIQKIVTDKDLGNDDKNTLTESGIEIHLV
jgi:DeoR family transcriptional regulator of aga operon